MERTEADELATGAPKFRMPAGNGDQIECLLDGAGVERGGNRRYVVFLLLSTCRLL
ncbi:MAG TPA: hypothetical protein VNJ52_04735 [Patescibacteria group bacterium]|nr:hypothetical protein [Patescibacteria group bacterium]